MRLLRPIAFTAFLLALLCTRPAPAQVIPGGDPRDVPRSRGTAIVRGTLTAAEDGEPLAGAVVSFRPGEHRTRTSEKGTWKLVDLPPGIGEVRIRSPGRLSRTIRVLLEPGTRLEVNLALRLERRTARPSAVWLIRPWRL